MTWIFNGNIHSHILKMQKVLIWFVFFSLFPAFSESIFGTGGESNFSCELQYMLQLSRIFSK